MSYPVVSWTSHIPDVLDGLVQLLEAATTDPQYNFAVSDGPFTSEASHQQIIVVGWSGFFPGYSYPSRSLSEEMGSPAVAFAGSQEGLGPTQRERFTISMASMVRSGTASNAEISAARRAAFTNATAVGRIVTVATITGQPMPAAPSWATQLPGPAWQLLAPVKNMTAGATGSLHQVQDRRGVLSVLAFSLDCEAWTQQ